MAHLDLTEQETRMLVDVLESTLSDLVAETVATDNRELKAELKERKNFIREIIARLAPQ